MPKTPAPLEAPDTVQTACPFYGRLLVLEPGGRHAFFLALAHNNQCALYTHSYTPCQMEVYDHTPADWTSCPLNPGRRPQ